MGVSLEAMQKQLAKTQEALNTYESAVKNAESAKAKAQVELAELDKLIDSSETLPTLGGDVPAQS